MPLAEVEKMMRAESMRETINELYAKINELMSELDVKIVLERRDGSMHILDDASQILEESLKEYK